MLRWRRLLGVSRRRRALRRRRGGRVVLLRGSFAVEDVVPPRGSDPRRERVLRVLHAPSQGVDERRSVEFSLLEEGVSRREDVGAFSRGADDAALLHELRLDDDGSVDRLGAVRAAEEEGPERVADGVAGPASGLEALEEAREVHVAADDAADLEAEAPLLALLAPLLRRGRLRAILIRRPRRARRLVIAPFPRRRRGGRPRWTWRLLFLACALFWLFLWGIRPCFFCLYGLFFCTAAGLQSCVCSTARVGVHAASSECKQRSCVDPCGAARLDNRCVLATGAVSMFLDRPRNPCVLAFVMTLVTPQRTPFDTAAVRMTTRSLSGWS